MSLEVGSVWRFKKERYAGYKGRIVVKGLNPFGDERFVTVRLVDYRGQQVQTYPKSYWTHCMEAVA